jgi:hypothetical protein
MQTKLSIHAWELKENGEDFNIEWELIERRHIQPYNQEMPSVLEREIPYNV